jgi:hypothetical protein
LDKNFMTKFDRYFDRIKATVSSNATVVSPKIKGLASASPKARAIAAGGALAVATGVAAPVALSTTGHDTPAPTTVTAEHITEAAKSNGAKPATSKAVSVSPPTEKQLHPVAEQGSQSDIPLSGDQMKNAQKIVEAGKAMGLPPRAWVIALATSMQETKLHNYGDLGDSNDHDSLGLFQQRPSSGWGTPQQLTDPSYASKAFYKSLTQVDGWSKMPLTDAAQAVQVSAFGDRYAQWEAKAGDVVDSMYGHGPLAAHTK